MEEEPQFFAHAVPETGRLLPSASRWNSIEIDFGLVPPSSNEHEDVPSKYSKSYDFDLRIANKTQFKRFIYISIFLILAAAAAALLASFLPHKRHHLGTSSNLPLALDHALLFFDAQKSGALPENNPVKFRGDSGLQDGIRKQINASLVGGFYDSGNNIKFSFPTAYTITLLSWTVIEYHQKYAEIGQLDHIKDIIKWGSEYLLKLYIPSGSTSKQALLFSQVGSSNNDTTSDNDITCWQRPEDMNYGRPVSICGSSASDLAGEMIAAMAAASLVFEEDEAYSRSLILASESLFELATKNKNKATYTANRECGGEARSFYNSTSYMDELVWGGTWLFFATGKFTYLKFATDNFESAVLEELPSDRGLFYWNNKIAATAVLLARLRYLHDPGYPYEETLKNCSAMANKLACSYLHLSATFRATPGGMPLPRPNGSAPLQYATTAAFLSKIYSDYLNIIQIPGGSCSTFSFSLDMLQDFSRLEVNYILGDNPLKMSYLVGFGDNFPKKVHHRAASIAWDGRNYTCAEGKKWQEAKEPNPNVLLGAMVAGPDKDGRFLDDRDRPEFTEPTISGNAGLVAALIALIDHPTNLGIDQERIFTKIS
ncbi:endoglucanase 10-like [Phoenix dactylifera]|uniref:Endoglucanase n=1 Tax=Phoenix dactylifera TaxID=42345 RepID=A0A8B7BVY2_PHODC|nr:endoglucanase 10-like [Phoenix dactylifera]